MKYYLYDDSEFHTDNAEKFIFIMDKNKKIKILYFFKKILSHNKITSIAENYSESLEKNRIKEISKEEYLITKI